MFKKTALNRIKANADAIAPKLQGMLADAQKEGMLLPEDFKGLKDDIEYCFVLPPGQLGVIGWKTKQELINYPDTVLLPNAERIKQAIISAIARKQEMDNNAAEGQDA